MSRFKLTPVLDGGSWVAVKPHISEILTAKRPDSPQREFVESLAEKDPQFARLLNFARVLVVIKNGRTVDETGFQKTHESPQSHDLYTLVAKASSFARATAIFKNARDILIAGRTTADYPDYIISDYTDMSQLGRWIIFFTVEARYVGKALEILSPDSDYPTTLLSESFTYPDNTAPGSFSPAWEVLDPYGNDGSQFAKIISNRLAIGDAAGLYKHVRPPAQTELHEIAFTMETGILTHVVETFTEWELLLTDGTNTYFTLYLRLVEDGTKHWGFRWNAGNDGYTRADATEFDIKIVCFQEKVTVYVDDVIVFSSINYDASGTVTQFEIKTPTTTYVGATVYFDDFTLKKYEWT